MKCRQCGKEIEKKNKKCPHCGHVRSFENIEIPLELGHLSLDQLQKHMQRLHFLSKGKYLFLLLVILVIVASISVRYLNDARVAPQVHNFHDDLIENVTSNASGNSVANFVNGALVLQYGDHLYATDVNGISEISLTLDQKKVVVQNKAAYLNATESGFYYINKDDHNTVYHYHIASASTTKLNIQATQLMVVGNYLYYLEDNATRAIYQMNKETSTTKKMTQSQCNQFKITGDWLYFSTADGLYQMPVLGGEIMKISDVDYPHFVVNNQNIYYIDAATGHVCRVKKDGGDVVAVVKEKTSCFLMTDTYLFYAKEDGGVYKQHRETGETSLLTSDKADQLQIAGTWLYYLTVSGEGRFVSVDEKNEMITPVDIISDTQ